MNNYTVVIADDEPLVLIGLQDMIDWKSQGFEIIGNARNGSLLENEIKTKKPDLVITDIKMPVKTGIEVLESLKAENPDASHSLFIFLTSFEEFQLIKKAMSLEAVDYLVKLELDEKQLEDALSRARERLDRINGNRKENSVNELQYLQERCFMRLLFSLDAEDIDPGDVGLELDAAAFTVCYITLGNIASDKANAMSLYQSACRLIKETVSRYLNCYLIQLDLGHAAIILPFNENQKAGYRSYISSASKVTLESLENYFSLKASAAIGPLVEDIRMLGDSFFKAKALSNAVKENERLTFFDHIQNRSLEIPEIKLDSQLLTKAFGELNAQLLEECMEKTIKEMKERSISRVNAMDTASTILYMATNLVPDAQTCLEEIFPPSENVFSFRQLYQAGSTEEVIAWLKRFSKGFSAIFAERKQDYRMQTVQKIQSYIKENVGRKLSLGEVASIFGYSQNYLSALFSRYASMSFVDYVNSAKIEKAKTMLADPNALVYEVATSLGFDSPFYFSKVFKKVTGISPTQYQNSLNHR